VAWVADGSGPPRVAFAVGRRAGGAVARNRVRRRLREVARRSSLPGGDWLIGAGPGAASASFAELSGWVSAAVSTLVGRS
jgi:ribonuclease P protein component